MLHASTKRFPAQSKAALWLAQAWIPAVLMAAGCSTTSDPDPLPEPRTVELDDRRTTEPDVAVGNFQAQIESLRTRLEIRPNDFSIRSILVERLLARTQFLGTYDDFAEVDALTADAMDPESPDALILRSSYLRAVHHFEESLELLDQAEALGAPAENLERARITTEVATGTDPALLLPRAEALVASLENYSNLAVLGTVLAELGRYIEADAAYLRALEVFRDVSPFTLGSVSFTRGVMWGEMADRPDLALILYEDAVRRLPQFVVANTHLSELEDDASAIARLRAFADVATEGDPEPAGRLAQRLDPADAEAFWNAGAARYEVLLERHRAAFLDHGSEFYVGRGDVELGLELALENLENRRTPRAYVVAINAALEADPEVACDLIEESVDLQTRHAVLAGLAEEGCR